MEVYLVQHGEAKPGAIDPERSLTDHGREEVERVTRRAAALRLQVAEVRHSDKLRARQTAEILAEQLSPSAGLREMEGLAPMDDPEKARIQIEAAQGPLMLVGHLPHLSRLASSLLVGDPAKEIIRFRNGAIICLVKAERGWLVGWMLTPELAGVKS